MQTTKALLKKRFKELFPQYRLLAIQLNGFSHSVFYDEGSKHSPVETMEYSVYVPSGAKLSELFNGFFNYAYQGNPKEYVYVLPTER